MLYERHLPADLQKHYKEALNDPNLLRVESSIGILERLKRELEAKKNKSDQDMKEIAKIGKEIVKMQRSQARMDRQTKGVEAKVQRAIRDVDKKKRKA